jgi:hypothetical protein
MISRLLRTVQTGYAISSFFAIIHYTVRILFERTDVLAGHRHSAMMTFSPLRLCYHDDPDADQEGRET